MPLVPERKPSHGENLNRLRILHNRAIEKKPIYEEPGPRSKHGIVKIIETELPHPFKCSKCEYIGTSRSNFNNHWTLNH